MIDCIYDSIKASPLIFDLKYCLNFDLQYRQEIYQNSDITTFKKNSGLKKLLTLFNMIFGVYENIFINIDYHSPNFYLPRQTKNYIIFYFLFYIENIIFSIILYYEFTNNLWILFFYVLTFPISVLIQILYRRVKLGKEVSFLVFN